MKKNNNTKDLLKEAIADAQRIKETALENAKMVIEESLSPKLKRILSEKLNEMANEDDDLNESEELEEELDIDAILRELEDEELNESEDLDEAEDKDDKPKPKKDDKPKPKKDDEDESDTDDDEDLDLEDDGLGDEGDDLDSEDDKDIKDMNANELSDLITKIITDVMASTNGDGGLEGDTIDPIDTGDGLDLDDDGADDFGGMGDEEDIDISEDDMSSLDNELENDEELFEALKQVNTLRSELNEVNLLNAKLLYMNKIFSKQALNETQKINVMKSFDKADTIKEAKLIFETLESKPQTSTSVKRKSLKEGLGSSSKIIMGNTKKPILEVNTQKARWQKLAGIA